MKKHIKLFIVQKLGNLKKDDRNLSSFFNPTIRRVTSINIYIIMILERRDYCEKKRNELLFNYNVDIIFNL